MSGWAATRIVFPSHCTKHIWVQCLSSVLPSSHVLLNQTIFLSHPTYILKFFLACFFFGCTVCPAQFSLLPWPLAGEQCPPWVQHCPLLENPCHLLNWPIESVGRSAIGETWVFKSPLPTTKWSRTVEHII